MSSIGSADGKRDEVTRRARESYQEKEVEQSKKHATEMKRVTEAHQEEIRQLKESYDTQMEDLKSRAHEAISNRDMRYQKDTSDLREMHQNQMRRQALEAENRVQLARSSAKEAIEKNSDVKDSQKRVMAEQYESQIERDNQRFENLTNESRTQLQTAISDNRKRLSEAHDKEIRTVISDRDKTKENSQRTFESMRKAKDAQIDSLEQSKRIESTRLNSAFSTVLREKDATNQRNLDELRTEMKSGVDDNREHFQKAIDERNAKSQSDIENFKETTGERINDRINTGRAENRQLKNELTRQRVSAERAKSREVQNVRDAMQNNIEELEEQKRELQSASNEKNKREIDYVQKRNEDILNRSNRFYQDKVVNEKAAADDRFAKTKMNLEKTIFANDLAADTRTQRLQEANNREELMLRDFYDKSSVAQRENFENSLRVIRETNRRDQDLIFQNMTKQANEREMKFQTKLAEINSKYETQIQAMKEEQAKVLAAQAAIAGKEKKAITDQKNGDLQRQAAQYENRIAKMEETHKREVETINRRHEESLVSMTRPKGRS